MNSKFYQILIVILFTYVCGVAIYTTWGLFQINLRGKNNEWFYYTMNDKLYKLKVADNETAYAKGLSGITKRPDNFDGMIFIFKEKRIMSFWNQGLSLDLDILWLDDFKIVGNDTLPAFSKAGLKIITPKQPVNYAIEIFKN